MKNLLYTFALLFAAYTAKGQLVSFYTGKLDSRLIPSDNNLQRPPDWGTSKTNWFSVKYGGMDSASKYIFELRLKQKEGYFSIEDGSQALSSGLNIHYSLTRLDLEARRKLKLFAPKFLYAEIGIFSGFMVKSKANGDSYFYLPPPINYNDNETINGSAKAYVQNFDIGLSSVIGAEYMFNEYLGISSQLFFNQGFLRAWNDQMKPARDWGWGVGIKLWLPNGD